MIPFPRNKKDGANAFRFTWPLDERKTQGDVYYLNSPDEFNALAAHITRVRHLADTDFKKLADYYHAQTCLITDEPGKHATHNLMGLAFEYAPTGLNSGLLSVTLTAAMDKAVFQRLLKCIGYKATRRV